MTPQSPSKYECVGLHMVLRINISCPTVFSCMEAESPEWIGISPKKLCMKRDAWAGKLSWWSYQSPVAHSCSILNYPNCFCKGMFKINAKLDADSLLYSLSHIGCDGHTVHMLTLWCLLPPLTSTMKSSLFTHTHSSPLSLAARLHWCHTNHSHYVKNGWTFSEQTLYVLFIYIFVL